jgi:peptidoglycan/xylan/chitin deacetylase (PgdA/CDA1 family)
VCGDGDEERKPVAGKQNTRSWRCAAFLAALAVAALAGCSSGDDNKPKTAASGDSVPSVGKPGSSASPTTGASASGAAGNAAELAAKWELKPFAPAPAPPAVKPVKLNPAKPTVFKSVPTDQKIVFVTIDDGAEKDPKFIEMLKDLNVPVTMFLTDSYVKQDPGYFKQLQALGNSVQNHTIDHSNLRVVSEAKQRQEVCGQQDRIAQEFGKRPTILRPPYGNYNDTTLAVAGSCGVGAVALWTESMQIHDMQYLNGDKKLRPGDVILAHFRGLPDLKGEETMTGMMGNLFRKIQAQGFTIARLEDYVG